MVRMIALLAVGFLSGVSAAMASLFGAERRLLGAVLLILLLIIFSPYLLGAAGVRGQLQSKAFFVGAGAFLAYLVVLALALYAVRHSQAHLLWGILSGVVFLVSYPFLFYRSILGTFGG